MFLLHGRLGGVDGLADAAQLEGKRRDRSLIFRLPNHVRFSARRQT